ncbi:hypothetical protein ACVXHA_01550 [Escherichia coli]
MLIASSPRIRRCCAAMSILCCQVSMRSSRRSTPAQVEIPETTLSALVAEQAAENRMLRHWQMRVTCSAIGKCASRWWRWRICCVSAVDGDSVAVALPRSVF